ncbi:MAG: ABC transporter substrate-binding protein [Deltaproteobacteria bacterium]|nr:ABC transporter substrate-binding protein [Deltaproteobacteria bacterium]
MNTRLENMDASKSANDVALDAARGETRLTLAVGGYDRTRALLEGRVKPEGIDLEARNEAIGEFCRRPVYEMYDVAEMSFSWYLMAHCRKEPVVALPIFPLRMWVHAFLFCRSDDSFTRPADLVGKRIGVPRYRWTVNLWMRGILQDHYGIRPQDFSWITTEEEGADFVIPNNVPVTVREGDDVEQLLLNREVEAILLPVLPKLFRQRDPRIRRLFPDCLNEIRNYYRETKIFPITHTVVMNQALWKRNPWTAKSLVEAFKAAQAECIQSYTDPKYLTLVQAPFILEDERAAFGPDPWAQGLEPNRHVLETFVRYAHEQGYIDHRPTLEELFAKNTCSL